MKTLPYDYSRCLNDKCELKHKCLRFIDRPNVILSFVAFIPNGNTCEYLIEKYGNPQADPETKC